MKKNSLINYLLNSSLSDMKNQIIVGENQKYSFGGYENIDEHIKMLQIEFIGRTELELYHSVLMVLLRRKIDINLNVERTKNLWSSEKKFLCENIDSRWLVSMCDTIIDYWEDDTERALALAGSLFTNTLKLYETERWASEQTGIQLNYKPISERIPLHDGLSAFLIGQGDMIFNLHKRIDAIGKINSIASSILLELINRANKNNTVFKRFKNVHQQNDTKW